MNKIHLSSIFLLHLEGRSAIVGLAFHLSGPGLDCQALLSTHFIELNQSLYLSKLCILLPQMMALGMLPSLKGCPGCYRTEHV